MKIFRQGGRKLEERIFNRRNDFDLLVKLSSSSCKEIIKCMEMYWIDPEDIPHWIEKVVRDIMMVVNPSSDIYSYHSFISVLDKEYIEKYIGSDVISRMKIKDPELFIDSVKRSIITEKGGKYPSLKSMSNFQYSNEYYVKLFRLLSAVLSGKTEINDIKINDKGDIVYPNPIPLILGGRIILSKERLKDILTNFIYVMNGSSDNGIIEEFL
jgi:hypothetical protein